MTELWHPTYALNETLRGLSRSRLGIDDSIGNAICLHVNMDIGELLSEEAARAFREIAENIEKVDRDLGGHGLRVGYIACSIAREMRKYEQVGLMLRCGLLHDIGKIAIEEDVLSKPGRLDDAEFIKVREHVKAGYALVGAHKGLSREAEITYNHHEQWSGRGYPQGLIGVRIPIEARILAVADTFDAIVSDRPGRVRRSNQEAEIEMKKAVKKGQLWAPGVEALFRFINNL